MLSEPMRYKTWRSHRDKEIQLICAEEGFDALPELIRKLGPWTGASDGAIDDLKPHYRTQLDGQGFALVYLRT
jgi:hypothetical protein